MARGTRGLSLLDLVVTLALLALLVWLLRFDWQHGAAAPEPAAHGATHSSRTSV